VLAQLPSVVTALFPYEPHWATVGGHQLHYVDEGPRVPHAVVLLHGNPTWSFLYRDVIPGIVGAGHRVVAPDYLGFGRSDHGTSEDDYAIAHHVGRTLATLDAAGVERAVLFCQDWGGPIGLGMALARPGLLAGLVLANTFWGEASTFQRSIVGWRALHAPLAGALLLKRRRLFTSALRLSGPPEIHEGAAWDAYTLPFDAHADATGAYAFPRAISTGPGHPTHELARAIWAAMPSMDVPTRMLWGDGDAVFTIEEQAVAFRDRLPRGEDHQLAVIEGARHFVQEYAPESCAVAVTAVAKEAFG
jgi:haloalkane dehalogenase